jgi:hypothetical protein
MSDRYSLLAGIEFNKNLYFISQMGRIIRVYNYILSLERREGGGYTFLLLVIELVPVRNRRRRTTCKECSFG